MERRALLCKRRFSAWRARFFADAILAKGELLEMPKLIERPDNILIPAAFVNMGCQPGVRSL